MTASSYTSGSSYFPSQSFPSQSSSTSYNCSASSASYALSAPISSLASQHTSTPTPPRALTSDNNLQSYGVVKPRETKRTFRTVHRNGIQKKRKKGGGGGNPYIGVKQESRKTYSARYGMYGTHRYWRSTGHKSGRSAAKAYDAYVVAKHYHLFPTNKALNFPLDVPEATGARTSVCILCTMMQSLYDVGVRFYM